MRALGVLAIIAVSCTLVQGTAAYAQAQRPESSKQEVTAKDPEAKPFMLQKKGPARSSFPHHKKGEKMAGTCSIDCGGYGYETWAWDVQDCACQCSSLCASDCFAWEVGGPNTAYCFY